MVSSILSLENNVPGWDWVQSFMKRNGLTQRMAGNIKVSRAKVDRETIKKYFENVEKALDGVPPENLVNYDETAMCDDPGKKRAIFKRGTKYPEAVRNHSKAGTSVMFLELPLGNFCRRTLCTRLRICTWSGLKVAQKVQSTRSPSPAGSMSVASRTGFLRSACPSSVEKAARRLSLATTCHLTCRSES